MRQVWLLLVALFLWPAAAAHAHRLDEYLQATTIDLARDHVVLQVRLTPGVAVAPQVLSAIGGADSAGAIPDARQRAYAEEVRRDLSLTADGAALPLHSVSGTFPTVAAMRNGVGDIVLTFDAPMPVFGSSHRLVFENRHQRGIAVYLVNCLMPRDAAIQVAAQQRNVDQSFYQLDFSTGGVPRSVQAIVVPQGWQPADEWAIVETFFGHGVHHILTGYDHLLFACALVLAATTLWDLIKVVTAFTLAHSITLTLAALDLVHVPSRVVEPLISASIVFVALQNIFWPASARGWSRLAVAFFFGLFHGLGFAGGLLDIMHQMPGTTILLAILGFSLGVEVGHQIVLLPLFGLLKMIRRSQKERGLSGRFQTVLQRTGSAGIAMAGMYYLGVALAGAS